MNSSNPDLPSYRSRRCDTLEDVTEIEKDDQQDSAKFSVLVLERDDLRKQVNALQCQLLDLEAALKEQHGQTREAERTIEELTRAQLEMKTLIDQERSIYNEERERLEEDIQRAKMVAEAKLRLIKNRLLTLFEGEFSQETPIEELIERLFVVYKRPRPNPQRALLNRSFDELPQRSPLQIDPYST